MSANRKNLLAGENNFQKVKSFLAFASTIYAYFLNFGALGYSLLESMVSLAIGLLIISALLTLYLHSNSASSTPEFDTN